MNFADATSIARARYTDPVAAIAQIAHVERLAPRIEQALHMRGIARDPRFRFGLEVSDTAVVLPAIEDEIARLATLARPIARKVLALRKRGMASDEICNALDLLPGEATILVSFCQIE